MRNLAQRAFKSGTFWLAVAVGILLFGVWQSDKNRPKVVRDAQVQFCQDVSRPAALAAAERDQDAIETQRDIAVFAQAAAAARRKEGQNKTAEIYEKVVVRAEGRVGSAKERKRNSVQRAAVPCERRFPEP